MHFLLSLTVMWSHAAFDSMMFDGPCALALGVLLFCVASLLAVPLNRAEHNALMAVYDKSVPPLSTSRYPRFGVDDECSGSRLSCRNGKVVYL